jgi:hypothetical protein
VEFLHLTKSCLYSTGGVKTLNNSLAVNGNQENYRSFSFSVPHHLALVIKLNTALGDKMIEKPVI